MINPFENWMRLTAAAIDVNRAGMRASETLSASGAVVADRAEIIGEALRWPLGADIGEMSRMVPEKVEAFSQAALALMSEMTVLQLGFLAEVQHIGLLAMRGRAPTMAEVQALTSRSAAYALRTVERSAKSGSTVIAPIHAKATANARRLKRRRSR